jgi:hypothetical protein
MMQAHGYFGCADTDTQINFVMPSTQQFVHIFAEVDLSVVPNRFDIKATAMSNSNAWTPRTDNLSATPNGRFQLHLYQVTLTATNITLADRRAFINKPRDAVNAENATQATNATDATNATTAAGFTANGGIATALGLKANLASPALTGTPTAPTATQATNTTQVATTAYVRQAISDVRNITSAAMTIDSRLQNIGTNQVRRQVNFVVGNFSNTRSTATGANIFVGNTLATIPEGFRPRNAFTIGVPIDVYTNSWNNATLRWLTTAGTLTVNTNGTIVFTSIVVPNLSGSDSWNSVTTGRVFNFNFGYEIT